LATAVGSEQADQLAVRHVDTDAGDDPFLADVNGQAANGDAHSPPPYRCGRRRIRTISGGAPMKEVLAPIGISCVATRVRASRSPTIVNEAPNKAPTGSTRRWSEPTTRRTM